MSSFGLLDDLVVEGKIRYYGVALGEEAESEEVGEGAIDERGVASLQTEFGLLRQRPGRNLIARAQSATTAVLAYDPSASGALERPPDEQSADPAESFKRDVYERRQYGRDVLVSALREFGGDVSAWAVKFALASRRGGVGAARNHVLRAAAGTGGHSGFVGCSEGVRGGGVWGV